MRPRLIRRCVLFALLGLVTSVAVAWGCSAYWQLHRQYPSHLLRGVAVADDITTVVTVHRAAGLYREEWLLIAPETVSFRYAMLQVLRSKEIGSLAPASAAGDDNVIRGKAIRANALAARGPRPKPAAPAEGQTLIQRVVAGWPLGALRYCSRTDDIPGPLPGATRTTRRFMLQAPWGEGPAGSAAALTGVITLPLEPRPGLLVNTIFYALLWAAILLAPGALRRRIRRARGRCAQCGYSLRGQPTPGCPECGQGRSATLPPAVD